MIASDVNAPHSCPTATPARIVRPGGNAPERPVAMPSTRIIVRIAPQKAATVRVKGPETNGRLKPNTSTATAPTDAPEEMPSR